MNGRIGNTIRANNVVSASRRGRYVLSLFAGVCLLTVTAASAQVALRGLSGAGDEVKAPKVPFVVKAEAGTFSEDRVLVKLRPQRVAATGAGTGLPHVQGLKSLTPSPIKTAGVTDKAEWLVAELDDSATVAETLEVLSVHDDVVAVEPDYLRSLPEPRQGAAAAAGAKATTDPGSPQQWALDAIQAHDAWTVEGGSRQVVVAVIDTGVDMTHEDLAAQIWINPYEVVNGIDDDGNGYVDDVHGYDFVNNDGDPSDDNMHGTHVSGIVAATRNNAMGVAGTADVSIMGLKVLDYEGWGTDSDIAAAVVYATQNGADVINMSLRMGSYSTVLAEACEGAAAAGVTVVAASGNDYQTQIGFPASLGCVIAVGATDVYDQLADFSNTGYGLELVAPGVDVLSTVIGSKYNSLDGTSMASPYVAGVAALVRSAHPELSAEEVRAVLGGSTDDLGNAGYDTTFGYGRVNAYRAVTRDGEPVTPPHNETPEEDDDELEPNDTFDTRTEISAGTYELQGLDDDWFAFELAQAGQVNLTLNGPAGDLDLYLFDASGQEAGYSGNYGSYEQISVSAAAGAYTLLVRPYAGATSSYTLTLDIAADTPPDPPVTGAGYAVLVGINQYSPNYGPGNLTVCVKDAEGIRDRLLTGTPGSIWSSANIQLFADAQATKAAARGALQNLAASTSAGDVIVYFQSSHGGQSYGTSTYLCMHDASYTDAELGQDLARFTAGQQIVVIIDACHSGGLFQSKGWDFAERTMASFKAASVAQIQAQGGEIPKDLGSNIAFMTACNYDQTCLEGWTYSVYTGELIAACSQASADTNNDGVVQFWEIHAYAAAEASRRNQGQTAQHFNRTLLERISVRGVGGSDTPTDDQYEPNNGAGDARQIQIGQRYNLVCRDEDWFVFNATQSGDIVVRIWGTQGDLDLYLYDANDQLLDYSESTSSNESVVVPAGSGTYKVAVAPYSDQAADYTLELQTGGCGEGAGQSLMMGLFAMAGIVTPVRLLKGGRRRR